MPATKKECIALILAGGQGSRLIPLTQRIAKPAVPFGGKYRIIDYTLSNCVHSGIDTVGVLTQYQPLVLNEYLGNGQPWDLDRINGGVTILPPFQSNGSYDWYKGTADAVYQNIHYIDRSSPDYVLILSGDHIYRMDYSLMLDSHIKNNADATIAVLNVPLEEASRYGIMNINDDLSIYEFEEKPKIPKSTTASMGIYIFKWDKLRGYLVADAADGASAHDFGKNVIPAMLSAGERMFAYLFSGYWRDVGTIDSLWNSNMDMLKPEYQSLFADWRIYSRNMGKPPQYIGKTGRIINSIVTEGCEIYGTVENSILFPGVKICQDTTVKDSIIMANSYIGQGCKVSYSIIDEDVHVEDGSSVGQNKDSGAGIVVIPRETVIGRAQKIATAKDLEK